MKVRAARALAVRLTLAAAVAAMVAAAPVARAGDPTRVWRTIESEHFVIHYYAPLDAVAHRVAVVAERAHRTLAPVLDHEPDAKTTIVLVDDTDSANGFASVVPKNEIHLFATSPAGSAALVDHDDWLYGLVAHEYTHILHLDTFSGLPDVYNAIFGKSWAPNQIMPRWLIEGIAVYEESKRSAGGRNRGSIFDSYIRVASLAHDTMGLDEVSGAPRAFPRGNAPYVYGSHFLGYVFDRFGDEALRRMSHAAGSWPLPYALNRQIQQVVGRPFPEIYDAWRGQLTDRYALQAQAVARRGGDRSHALTHSESNLRPRYSPDGTHLLWVQSNGYDLPMLRSMPVGTGEADGRDYAELENMGAYSVDRDGSIVFETTRPYRRDYQFQDAYRWDKATGRIDRLTRGLRIRDPAVSPDGRQVAFGINGDSRSVLGIVDAQSRAATGPSLTAPRVLWQGGAFDQAYQPAWSPDGTRIAFSAWRTGGYRDILVVDVATGAVAELTRDRAIDGSPAWSPDGRTVFFDSDRTGIQNLFAFDLDDRRTWQVTDVLGGAAEVGISPDGTRLAFHSLGDDGFQLHEQPMDRATWREAPAYIDDRPPPVEIRDDETWASTPRRYRAVESLAPLRWTAAYAIVDGGATATVQTNGGDDAGLHGYALAVGLDTTDGDVSVGASYGYTGLRPSLRLYGAHAVNDRVGFRVDGRALPYREEALGLTGSVGLPGEARPGVSWSMSLDYDFDWVRLVDTPTFIDDPGNISSVPPRSGYVQTGLAFRAGISSLAGTTFGLGSTRGAELNTSLRLDDPALGAEFRNLSVNYSARWFRRLWGDTPVLAVRVAGGFRAGDLIRGASFSLGGLPEQDVPRSILDNARVGAVGYLHGFAARAVVGSQYHIANVEYRQELWSIERGLSTLPFYVRRLHGALLSDAGLAFGGEPKASDVRIGVGAALRLDAFIGYYVPGTFELGYAHGFGDKGTDQTWLFLTGGL